MATEQEQLNEVRQRIDSLDQQIHELISERARCAQEVGRIKLAAGDEAVFYRPEREAQVLRKIMQRNQGPLDDRTMAVLFREIMSACLALEQPLTVAYLGPAGTFTQAASYKHFGHAARTQPVASIGEVFRSVEAGNADYGVVPVENSTEGVVAHTLDMFLVSSLKICGEVELRIHHNLMGKDSRPQDIAKVYSHQQSLAQCRNWLDRHLPQAQRIPVSSNAEAARLAAEEGAGAAAIAGKEAAEIYGLDILVPHIEDEVNNTTRFLVIGDEEVPPSGNDKTSIMFAAENRPGALFEHLAPLAKRGIGMTRIESRPTRQRAWEYMFFIDLEGHRDDAPVAEALEELRRQATLLTVLGSYPRNVL